MLNISIVLKSQTQLLRRKIITICGGLKYFNFFMVMEGNWQKKNVYIY